MLLSDAGTVQQYVDCNAPAAPVPAPVAPTPSPTIAPVPVPAAPTPVPAAPTPVPVAPSPVPAAPSPVAPSPVPNPVPVAPTPVPQPVPVAPSPVPAIAPTPAPAPVPVPAAPTPIPVPVASFQYGRTEGSLNASSRCEVFAFDATFFASSFVGNGSVAYIDSNLTTPLNGGNLYFGIDTIEQGTPNNTYRVSSSGILSLETACTGGGGF